MILFTRKFSMDFYYMIFKKKNTPPQKKKFHTIKLKKDGETYMIIFLAYCCCSVCNVFETLVLQNVHIEPPPPQLWKVRNVMLLV